MMTSCGSKHTLVLDSTGQLWYFGLVASLGLIEKEEKQMVITKLDMPGNIKQEPIVYISTKDEQNLALSVSGKIVMFGKDNSPNYVPFADKATLICCGPEHFISCDTKAYPYSWGNALNGRCGIPQD